MKKIVGILLMTCVLLSLPGCTTNKQIKQRADEIVERYNSGELEYDTAKEKINNLQAETDNYDINEYMDDIYRKIDELKTSKEKYQEAEKAYDGENYPYAAKLYGGVSKEDENYDDAVKKLDDSKKKCLDIADKKADKYIEDGKYQEAITVYKNVKSTYDDDSVDEKIKGVENAYREYVEKEANRFEASTEWSKAIDLYKKTQNYFGDKSYEEKIKSDEISWADQAVDESEDYLKNGEYEEAKAVLEEADRVITQGSGILQQMNRVKEYSPVKLTDLTPFFEEDDGYGTILDEWTVQDKDNLGNGGKTGIKIRSKGSYGSWAYVGYMINGKYDTLKGTFAIHEDFKNNTNTEQNWGQVAVFDENDEMIYCSEPTLGGVEPVDIEVNISGMNRLKIGFYIGTPRASFLLDDVSAYGFIDPTLQKTYEPK